MLLSTIFVALLLIFCSAKSEKRQVVRLKLDEKNPNDPGKCNSSNHGRMKLVRDRNGDERTIICNKDESNSYLWKSIDGSSTLGEYFDPAIDCAEVVDKIPNAKNGFYWINPKEVKKVVKAWCDVTTDGGGYLLIATKNNSITWTVPSSAEVVDPFGDPHWSSIFGNIEILDIRFQFSTSKNFSDTKAHWSFRLANPRRLDKLLIRDKGGCTKHNPGIGDILFVKDLQVGKVVSKDFRCSLFGGHVSPRLGWGMMNKCLQRPCQGFAFIPGFKDYRVDDSGSFSYSAKNNTRRSGIIHSSTAFIGCSHAQCCACYGPKGGTDNYCLNNCTSINGGKVIKEVYTWVWIRSSLPKRLWRKCIDYTIKDSQGNEESYRLDEETGVKEKGNCATMQEIRKNGAVLVVPDTKRLKKIPRAPGLLVFLPKSKKLQIQGQQELETIAMKTEVTEAEKTFLQKLTMEQQKQTLINKNFRKKQKKIEQKLVNLEAKTVNKQKALEKQQRSSKKILEGKIKKVDKQQKISESNLKSTIQRLTRQIQRLENKKMNEIDSIILRGKTSYKNLLSKWAPFSQSWTLCYRGSRDGWRSRTFHSRCDNKGATVTIIRYNSYIFGGYTDASWGGSSRYISSWDSFIFSFKNRYNVPPFKAILYRYSQDAIFTASGYGPTFGSGHDIYISDNAGFNSNSHLNFGHTYKLPYGYSYPTSQSKVFLAGTYHFRPSEVEVFYAG